MYEDSLVGEELAGYRIERLVSRGKTGRLYLARQLSLERQVALKLLDVDAGSEQFEAMLDRHARDHARLEHPNIVPLYATGKTSGVFFYVLRWVDGYSLANSLRLGLELSQGLQYLAEIAGALGYAHDRGVRHGNLRPSAIFVDNDKAMIAGFGLSRLCHEWLTGPDSTSTCLLPYLAPEKLRLEPVGPRADFWAVGVILFQVVTGRHPFASARSSDQLIEKVVEARLDATQGLPGPVLEVLSGTLRADPEDRYASAETLQEALHECLRMTTPSGRFDRQLA